MRPLISIAVLVSATAAFADSDAIIWTSEVTQESAAAQLAKAQPALKAAGLKLVEGWPRIIDSADVSGLKPGYKVVLIGYCASADTTRVLLRAKSAQRLAYVRKVTLTDPQTKEAQCPGVDASVQTPPVPAFLVAATSKNKLELESKIESLKRDGALEMPDGYPKVVETKSLKIAVPPGKTAEKFLLVLGVCEVTRAEIVLGSAGLYGDWPAWALGDVPLVCPGISDKGVPKALDKAIALDDPGMVKELAERTTTPEARGSAINQAAEAYRSRALKALFAAFGKSPALATAALPRAFRPWDNGPDPVPARRETVEALLEAGATVTAGALEGAVSRCDVTSTRLFLEKGAKPDPKTDLISQTLHCVSPDVVMLLLEKNVVKLGGTDDAHALIFAHDSLRASMLKKGAPLDTKDKGGLSLLDLVVLFPQKDDPARKQLLEARPALALGFSGDAPEAIGGWSPLALAASTGDLAAVKKQLDKGAKADVAVMLGTSTLGSVTPLALAMDASSEAAALALLEKGASATAPSGLCCELREKRKVWAPWVSFRAEKHLLRTPPRFERERLAAGPPGLEWKAVSSSYDELEVWPVSITPLGRAALHGQLAVAKALLEKGANVDDGIGSLGLTPLMLAAQHGRGDLVDLLLAKGAKPDAADSRGVPVLGHLAIGNADVALVQKVLKKKKGIAQVPGLLVLAATFGMNDVVDALVKAGAGKNGEGKVAVKSVCDSGDDDRQGIFNTLETAGYSSGQDWYGGCVQEGD